jgi:hypothetical protein
VVLLPHQQILFTPEVEEIRVSPIISKRGTLNILDQRNKVIIAIMIGFATYIFFAKNSGRGKGRFWA